MKIYDCFTFANELDLLEVRLKETYEQVDQFVIVESDITFTGKPKPLYLADNWERFAPWHDKIKLIRATDLIAGDNPWNNEAKSRENLLRAVDNVDPADLILVSDVDEIFRASTMDLMRKHDKPYYGFRLPYFSLKLNYLKLEPDAWWAGGSAIRRQYITSMEKLRNERERIGHDIGTVIRHAGWHFTNIASDDEIKNKLASFSHTEVCVPAILDRINANKLVESNQGIDPESKYRSVAFDHYFPKSMMDDARWDNFIIPNAQGHAREILNEHKVTARLQQNGTN